MAFLTMKTGRNLYDAGMGSSHMAGAAAHGKYHVDKHHVAVLRSRHVVTVREDHVGATPSRLSHVARCHNGISYPIGVQTLIKEEKNGKLQKL